MPVAEPIQHRRVHAPSQFTQFGQCLPDFSKIFEAGGGLLAGSVVSGVVAFPGGSYRCVACDSRQ